MEWVLTNLLSAPGTAFAAPLSYVVGVLSVLSSTRHWITGPGISLHLYLKTAVHNNLFAQGTGFMEDSSVDGGRGKGG